MKNLLAITLSLLLANASYATLPQQNAIASAHPLATQAGMDILQQGGNAFDAAVAVSAVLGVVTPFSAGLGGGGFWLLHDEARAKQIMIDGREVAPFAASADMYLDQSGEVRRRASIDGALAAAIPGFPAALVHIANNYGNLPLATSLQAAIDLAQNGFAVGKHYHRLAKYRYLVLFANHAASAIFLPNGAVPQIGDKIIQTDLAETLRLLAQHGFAGFYLGDNAKKLLDGVQAGGGIWTAKDLASYTVKERQPVVINYHDMKITTAALPSSGGLVLALALNILEQYNLPALADDTRIHLVVEAMRRGYRDRALYMGDSDFVAVPDKITSKKYAHQIGADLTLGKATANDASNLEKLDGQDTTHFSILDHNGNRVAATMSINYPFGAGFVAPGTGVLLNDEMDDFSSKPGAPNVYGLVGNKANAIAPGKRPLSSMSPTFFETASKVGILGTPGGSRIISMVLLAILHAHTDTPPSSWAALPRYHHQYLPDQIQHEPNAFPPNIAKSLQQKGHTLKPVGRYYGNMQAILYNKTSGTVSAASDTRGEGMAVVE